MDLFAGAEEGWVEAAGVESLFGAVGECTAAVSARVLKTPAKFAKVTLDHDIKLSDLFGTFVGDDGAIDDGKVLVDHVSDLGRKFEKRLEAYCQFSIFEI